MSDSFEQVLAELEDRTGYAPRGSGDRRKAMCPAHDDQKASLVVRRDAEAGLIGLTCFAGCTFDEVRGALGLNSIDFRLTTNGHRPRRTRPKPAVVEKTPARVTNVEGREVARYVYTDEEGTTLYYNVRFEPKDFRMADRNGEVKQLPRNLVRVPYRLPEVLAAIAAGRTVYWVEGEKDADKLWELGHAATTSAGGANERSNVILPEWARWFRDADLVAVADRDKAGRSYARAVARVMINEAKSVRLAQSATPQAKSDISDHLAAGYRLDQLDWLPLRSIRRTRWTVSALLEHQPEPIRWVLPGMIPEGLTLLVGAPKAGKSWWNLGLLVSLASGRPDKVFDWGQHQDPSPSLYLALEDPQRRIHGRMTQVLTGLPNLDFSAHGAGDVWLDIPPIGDGGRAEIERWLEEHPTTRAIMVDVLAKVRGSGKAGETQTLYQLDYDAIGILKDIADDYGIGVVVTHHDRKKGDEDFLNMVSGTKGLTGAADTILYLTRPRGGSKGEMKLESRDVEECVFDMEFDYEQGRWHILDRRDLASDKPQNQSRHGYDTLRRIIAARGESSADELARITDQDPKNVRRQLQAAKQDLVLDQTNNGLWFVVKT